MTPVSEVPPVSRELLRRKLIARLGEGKFNLWFRAAGIGWEEGTLRITAPNRFVGEWVRQHFRDELDELARSEGGLRATIEVGSAAPPDAAADPGKRDEPRDPPRPQARIARPQPCSRHELKDFVVGPSNELAFIAVQRLSEAAPNTPHGLFVHGACGLGKTHLLQGLCRRYTERDPRARVCYTTAEEFTNQYIHAVRNNKLADLRRKLRRVDLLAVDDVHFLSSKPATQTEFLHTFDAIAQSGAKVALASDAHPKQIRAMAEALISRFMSGMVAHIDPPDSETRLRLVVALAKRRGLRLLESAAHQLAMSDQVGSSVREIEGALTRLAAIASLDAAPSQELGHHAVSRLTDPAPGILGRRPVRIEQIVQKVCTELGVERAHVLGRSRHARVVLARAMVIHLARRLTTLSYPELARELGRTNHSTVVTAQQRVSRQIKSHQPVPQTERIPAATYDQLVEHLARIVRKG